ncbi:MAG: hypothetical protein KGL39_44975 [Patescibacteria group bacterium]|nr:hypothetical protein [Patescibacteria group bacterium]
MTRSRLDQWQLTDPQPKRWQIVGVWVGLAALVVALVACAAVAMAGEPDNQFVEGHWCESGLTTGQLPGPFLILGGESDPTMSTMYCRPGACQILRETPLVNDHATFTCPAHYVIVQRHSDKHFMCAPESSLVEGRVE